MKSKFDGSKCGLCHEVIKKNVEIEKFELLWCHKDCIDARDQPGEKPKTETKPKKKKFEENTNFVNIIKTKIEAAEIATELYFDSCVKLAENYYPKDVKEFEGIKVDKNEKNRMILAQVFYKGYLELIE